MCLAQQLDYDEEYHEMHMEMKKAVSSKKDETPVILPETTPDASNLTRDGIEDLIKNFKPENLQSMLQNPALINMAQSMMQDPQAMQNMMNMLNKS